MERRTRVPSSTTTPRPSASLSAAAARIGSGELASTASGSRSSARRFGGPAGGRRNPFDARVARTGARTLSSSCPLASGGSTKLEDLAAGEARDEVQVEVEDALPGRLLVVLQQGQAVRVERRLERPAQPGCDREQVGRDLLGQLVEVGEVPARDEQHMARLQRADRPEGHAPVVLPDERRLARPGDDLAEDALGIELRPLALSQERPRGSTRGDRSGEQSPARDGGYELVHGTSFRGSLRPGTLAAGPALARESLRPASLAGDALRSRYFRVESFSGM